MSEENEVITTEEVAEESVEIEATIEEVVEETVSSTASETVTETVSSSDKTDNVQFSIGTGREVYNGPCHMCGSHVTNGLVKDDKVNCLSCGASF